MFMYSFIVHVFALDMLYDNEHLISKKYGVLEYLRMQSLVQGGYNRHYSVFQFCWL